MTTARAITHTPSTPTAHAQNQAAPHIRRGHAAEDLWTNGRPPNRVATIIELLEWRRDVWTDRDPTGTSGRTGSSRALELDVAVDRSFRELERCLALLRLESRTNRTNHYRQVVALFDAPTRQISYVLRSDGSRVAPSKTWAQHQIVRREIVYLTPGFLDVERVRDGVEWVARTFRGRPTISRPLLPPKSGIREPREAKP